MVLTVFGSAVVTERMLKKKPFPSCFLLGGGLIFLLFYLAIWPMVWHLLLLPHARPDKHQLRLESSVPHRVDKTSLFLNKPDSSLSAYAVWQVPKEGFYHFKLSCDDNGKVIIDNRPIVTLQGTSPLNIGEGKEWLSSGPHFLELRLNNTLGQGWLRIEVAGPGQAGYSFLNLKELSHLELGNIKTWLDLVFWGKYLCLFGFLGFGLLWVRFYFRRWTNMPSHEQEAAKTKAQEKPIPSYILLGAGLFFFFFHFAVWPIVSHLILLPHARPNKHQLRIESSAPNRVDKTSLFLDKPDSSLSAYAVWQVPKEGLYHIKLSCADNGKILIDNRPIIILKGTNSLNVGETKQWLTPGPHFLELDLNNELGQGWLKIEVARPGQANYSPLNTEELSYLELGNISTWLEVVSWGEYLCFLGFLGLILLWVGLFYFRRRQGKLFPNRSWKYFFLALTIFTATLSIIYHTEHPIPPIWSDGLGYYSYLPSYLIYHDLSMESLYSPTRLYDYPSTSSGSDLHDGEGFIRYPATGRYLIKYPMGTAVLIFPFFLLGHLLAPLVGSTPDGFSLVYQFAVGIASVFYMLAGLVLIFKILIRYFSSKVVAATLLSLFLGTNLLAYAAVEISLSHIYAFFLICLLLFLVPRWYAAPTLMNTFFLGIVSGLIPLVRNPNAVFLVFLPLYGITNWGSLKKRARFLWQIKNKVFFLMVVTFLVFSPQFLIWKIATGQFLVSTYTFSFERFYFLSPQILKVLFHLHHGLFLWTPILLFSVFGFWNMKGPLKAYLLPIAVCLLLHLYVVSSWYLWYFAWSFGHRAFVDELGLFALPLACFFGGLQKTIIKRSVIIVSTFFIAFTFYLFIQYFQGVLPGEIRPHTWPVYKKILLDRSGMIYLWKWLKNPQMNNHRLLK
jgi:hypothetical protein